MKSNSTDISSRLKRWLLLDIDKNTLHNGVHTDSAYLAAQNIKLIKKYALYSTYVLPIMIVFRCLYAGFRFQTLFPGIAALISMLTVCILLRWVHPKKHPIAFSNIITCFFLFIWYLSAFHYNMIVLPNSIAVMTYFCFAFFPALLNTRPIYNILGTLTAYLTMLIFSIVNCPPFILFQNAFYCLAAGCLSVYLGQRNTANDLRQKRHLDMYQSASKISILVVQVDIPHDTFWVLQCPDYMEEGMAISQSASSTAELIRTMFVSEPFREEYRTFIDLNTMSQRLKSQEPLSMTFIDFRGRWCQLILSEQYRAHDEITGFIATVRDIDEEKRRELAYQQQLEAAMDTAERANAAKTNFLSRMTHDIRTPLNGIIGLLKINENHKEDIPLIQQNQQKMLVNANYLLSLINDMLEMSKLESGELVLSHEVLDLRKLGAEISEIVGQRAAEAGVTMKFSANGDKMAYPYVYGSPLHLRQIFMNIYSNGIKYNHKGGSVHSMFENLSIQNGVAVYRWTISDTGIGMSEKFQKHLFEPFAQERQDARSVLGGTGLGMAIVKSLVDKMNGTITVNSIQNIGTTFILTIPFKIAEKSEMDASATLQKSSIAGLKLLLAEDNALNAEIAKTLLEDEGAFVTIAEDGDQVLQAFTLTNPGTYDAILMDIMMPKMDGITATRAIRALKRPDAQTIPIIAMTANAFVEDAKECMDAGMNAHLSKPLQMDLVIATISGCCSSNS